MTALDTKIILVFLSHKQNKLDNKSWSQGPKYSTKTK